MVLRHTDFGSLENYLDGYSIAGDTLASLQIPATILTSADDPVIPVADFRTLVLPPNVNSRSPRTADTADSSATFRCTVSPRTTSPSACCSTSRRPSARVATKIPPRRKRSVCAFSRPEPCARVPSRAARRRARPSAPTTAACRGFREQVLLRRRDLFGRRGVKRGDDDLFDLGAGESVVRPRRAQ